jgi:hypothetical protein
MWFMASHLPPCSHPVPTANPGPGCPAGQGTRRGMTTMLAVAVLILSGCRRETAQEGPGGPAHLRPATSGTEFFRAGTETEAVPVQVPEGVTRFFERAGVASRSTVPIEARDFFSLDAMVAAIGSLGVLREWPPRKGKHSARGSRTAS